MGLDLFCTGTESIKMGSYSTVQEIRIHWILAYIEYLQATNPTTFLIKDLKQCIENNEINYKAFLKLRNHNQEGFTGLFDFVYHSDCDGMWVPEEVEQILTTLDLVRQNLIAKTFSWHFYDENQYYLEEMFKYSVENDENIRFS